MTKKSKDKLYTNIIRIVFTAIMIVSIVGAVKLMQLQSNIEYEDKLFRESFETELTNWTRDETLIYYPKRPSFKHR